MNLDAANRQHVRAVGGSGTRRLERSWIADLVIAVLAGALVAVVIAWLVWPP